MSKKQDPASALMTVISALEPLTDIEKQWVLQSAASRWTLAVSLQSAGAGITSGAGSQGGESGRKGGDVEAAISKSDPRAFIRTKNHNTTFNVSPAWAIST